VSPQETAVAPNLTVRENLELMARIYGFGNEDAGDVNFNGVNDVSDVTLIQLHIAGKYEFERKSTDTALFQKLRLQIL
jgi:ABC-type Na+ transport system ATPase subunit NatA